MDARISRRARGFTLLEIIVVIALTAFIAGFALIVSLDDYRGFGFRNERDVVVAVLQKARSQAVNNMCFERGSISCTDGKPHGAYFGNDGEYVIFQGASYASRDADADEIIDAKDGGTGVSGFTEVVFERLSGDASTNPSGIRTLTVTDESGRASVFTVEASGRIWWTN